MAAFGWFFSIASVLPADLSSGKIQMHLRINEKPL